MKIVLCFLLAVLSFQSCKSIEDKEMDRVYEKFKNVIKEDDMNVAAINDAKLIAMGHYDTLKRKEATIWISKYEDYSKEIAKAVFDERLNNQLFLERNLKLNRVLHKEEQCNFMQVHILAKSNAENKDSLTLAVRIITDSLFSSIRYSNDCVKKIRCGVYIYKKEKDFELEGGRYWFAMGTRISAEETKVQFMDWGKYN